MPVTERMAPPAALFGSLVEAREPPLPREIWFEGDGTRLFALESGVASGPTVVMLHGGLASHLAILSLVQPLATRCRVLTPDLRASGRSHGADPLTFDRLADDVAALLDHRGVHRAIVGGVSSGSGVALRFALRHPERVGALVLVKPMYAGADRGYDGAQRETYARMDALARRAPTEGIAVLGPLYAELPAGVREKALAMLDAFDPAGVAATSRLLSSGVQPFAAASDLRTITMPVLLARGNDALHPSALSDLYEQSLERAEVLPASTQDLSDAIGAFCDRVVEEDWARRREEP